jgi:DNA-binding transcriptional regulator/RsmH inhibitor MraZ
MASSILALPPRTYATASFLLPFTGTSLRRVDAKHRVVLPAVAARAICEAGGDVYIVPGREGGGLEILPGRAFEELVLSPCRSTADAGEARRLDALIAAAERVVIRGPGRITIPPRYRARFPSGRVLVVGRDAYLEVVDAGATPPGAARVETCAAYDLVRGGRP